MLETRDKRFRLIRIIALGYVLSPVALYGWLNFRYGTETELGFSFTALFFLWLLAFPVVAMVCSLIEVIGKALNEQDYK